ncbi:ANTH-domain-containing protein [Sporormia fimetaria CBS 119925]|uniref:ANTH-domain-containing protein n=1 Tax=Sporormia fimetaria CBS 119925 TaxID=1340428 RepID=A0A6A6VND3_9PLEO|nr:ANTH-domain-containing protein [Sporormia fimetaria CBS 119925]
MSSSFEKSVKGGTKIKLAAPKSKYVEHILVATHAGEAGVAEIFRALTNRLRDSTWTIVFKSLIIVHLMIREGEPEVTLKYLAQNPSRKLALNHFTEVQTQGHNIKTYSEYLLTRAKEYAATRVDYVRGGEGRLKKLNIEKGLLRETESIQNQIRYLLRCQPFDDEPENEITLTAFRLLTMDLLVLFHVMNEGTINVLEHYFELSKPDAERALQIYRCFVKQTEAVVQYLSIARMHEHSTRLEIPKIKHAPTSLAASLEEYLNDKDFEINRRQYLAEREAKRNGGKPTNGASKPSLDAKSASKPPTTSRTTTTTPAATAATAPKPASNAPLIDLFESIADNQQTMAQPPVQQYPQGTGLQQTGIQAQQQPVTSPAYGQTNPFAMMQQNAQQQPQQQPLQTQFTNTGFGGYTAQGFNAQNPSLSSIPQNSVPGFSPPPAQGLAGFSPPIQQPSVTGFAPQNQSILNVAEPLQAQPTSTNPFRQSTINPLMMGTDPQLLNNPTGASSLARSPTNPFAKHNTGLHSQSPVAMSSSPFPGMPSIHEGQANAPFPPQQQQQQLQPAPTGTNPFARNASPNQATPPPQGGLTVHATGSTNPFRQSAFVNQHTGQGWQNSGTGTFGGMSLDQVPTTNVFPRPGQQPGQYMG